VIAAFGLGLITGAALATSMIVAALLLVRAYRRQHPFILDLPHEGRS
jgi:hypothetical protein